MHVVKKYADILMHPLDMENYWLTQMTIHVFLRNKLLRGKSFCLFIQYAQSIEHGDIVSKNIMSLYDLEYIYIYVVVLFYTNTCKIVTTKSYTYECLLCSMLKKITPRPKSFISNLNIIHSKS